MVNDDIYSRTSTLANCYVHLLSLAGNGINLGKFHSITVKAAQIWKTKYKRRMGVTSFNSLAFCYNSTQCFLVAFLLSFKVVLWSKIDSEDVAVVNQRRQTVVLASECEDYDIKTLIAREMDDNDE
ncbi:hypothetical protein C1645_827906 [Glomus cerebriforme]|uniref:Uncharacterized protein n=1 Tax=Glomus cerebriforme TaxID=658196 RepID=A0A397SQZ2_9GLOM|nr:hypothetical protein C1645_827906 [Glomus cerebriforme]